MKHLLIVSVLTVLPMSSQAEQFDTIEEAIHAFSIEAQKCSLYLNGSYYHMSDSDIRGEQLAATSCIKFITGYHDLQNMGVTESIKQLHDEFFKGNNAAKDVRYMNGVYQDMIDEVWKPKEEIDKSIQKELDEEDKDINPAIYKY